VNGVAEPQRLLAVRVAVTAEHSRDLLEFLRRAGSSAFELSPGLLVLFVPAELGERRFCVDLRFALAAWAHARDVPTPTLLV
jgi:hypothetical protein